MGVKQCDRRGCQSIMCDHYSNKYGYICIECRDELLNLRVICGVEPNIQDFMNSEKEYDYVHLDPCWESFIFEEFPSQTNYDLGGDV